MNIPLNRLKLLSQHGFTLIEMLISIAIMGVITFSLISVFTTQDKLIKNQNDGTVIRGLGRLAMDQLANELRMAGYGLPPGQGISSVTSNSITYFSNINDIGTRVVANIATTNTSVVVSDASSFEIDNSISIQNVITNDFDLMLIDAINGNSIEINETFNNSYNIIYPVTVNQYEESSIALAGDQIIKTVDGISSVIVANVSGLTFDYYDSNNALTASTSDIRQIAIYLELIDPENPTATIALNTNVNVRNMGT